MGWITRKVLAGYEDFLSQSNDFVRSLLRSELCWVGHRTVYSARREADFVMSSPISKCEPAPVFRNTVYLPYLNQYRDAREIERSFA